MTKTIVIAIIVVLAVGIIVGVHLHLFDFMDIVKTIHGKH